MTLSPIFRHLRPLLAGAVLLSLAASQSGCGLIGVGLKTALAIAPLKLLFQCLPEGTPIDTPQGPRPVESIRPGDQVIGYSGYPVKVLQVQAYAEDPEAEAFLRIEFEDGAVVDLCRQHRIGGIRAGGLVPGDRIEGGHTIRSIERYAGVERSYDLLTEDEGYRIGGVPVNSMIEEMYEAGHTGEIKE